MRLVSLQTVVKLQRTRVGFPLHRNFHYSRAMSQLLIEKREFSWLKELGLSSENKGVFDGNWKTGGGEVSNDNFWIRLTVIERNRNLN